MKILCNDILKNECPIVIDYEDKDYAVASYQAHAKGSHGIDVTEQQIMKTPVLKDEEPVENVVMEEPPVAEEEVNEIDYEKLPYKELVKLAAERGVFKAGMKKVQVIEALKRG